MRKINYKERGITLVALVITIIILLILAGVTISTALGQNGLFQRAKIAGEQYKNSEKKEDEYIKDINDEIDGLSGGSGTKTKLADLVGKEAKKENQQAVDDYGNIVTIPAGFTIVGDGEDNVEYNYAGNKNPNVQDGIVIEDKDGNQFVWIPVGKIINKEGSGEKETEIKLARRIFNNNGEIDEETETNEAIKKNYNYTEETEEEKRLDNEVAKNIELFKKSAKSNNGFYIARYEAGIINYDENNIEKTNSDYTSNWTGYQKKENGEELKVVTKQGQQVWNYITEPKASEVSRQMYQSDYYESDLINSYAWDTALFFIQSYSGNAKYSSETAKNYEENKENPDQSGERLNNTTDKVCNIYDMASNCCEFSTETMKERSDTDYNYYPVVIRGGEYNYEDYFAGFRDACSDYSCGATSSFRVNLYILS